MKLNKNDKFFWKKINRWQKNGWELGVHGLNHKIIVKCRFARN